MQQQAYEFALEEFKCLRAEIMDCLTAQRHLESLAVAAMGAVYYFLHTTRIDLPWAAWLIPAIFPAFGLIRTSAYRGQVLIIAEYVRRIEQKINPSEGFWEEFLHRKRTAPIRDYRAQLVGNSHMLSFGALLVGALSVAAMKFLGHI